MKKWRYGIALVLVLVAVFVGSPYFALWKIYTAYQQKDAPALASFVDWQAVQNNLNQELTQRLQYTMQHNPVLSGMLAIFANQQDIFVQSAHNHIQSSVHAAITEANLELLLHNQISAESKNLVAAWAMASDYLDYPKFVQDMLLSDTQTALHNQEQIVFAKLTQNKNTNSQAMQARYCGVNCFFVQGDIQGVSVAMTLYRYQGIFWKIEQIQIP